MHAFSGRRLTLRNDLAPDPDTRRAEAEAIALAYRSAYRDDERAALVAAITDALTDLDAAEQRERAARCAVSYGFVRGRLGAA
ncbi:hypothetical protein [Methylorubrum suomiense]|uniref:Uncharacterized protein n=1 Tax=Methylorubrum suomiense TaxID=144191 RepID=A0ABQ4UTU9_9HYPH|nr:MULTISPECIES: hypothetical protein [Methylobacteriaceae]GJE75615.1 hypothetical protein BGCPKDLD_2200 [Methylorubrum suomiense]